MSQEETRGNPSLGDTNSFSTLCMDISAYLPHFSGEGEDVDFFLSQFDELTSFQNWDDRRKLIILKSRLKCKALTYLMENHALKEENDYLVFKNKLRCKFAKEMPFDEMQNRFFKLQQNPGQTIREYTENFERLFNMYKPKNSSQNEDVSHFFKNLNLNQFIQGLKEDIKFEVIKRAPKTFQEAFESAVNIERAYNEVQICSVNNLKISQQNDFEVLMNKQLETSMQLQQLTQKLEELTKNVQYQSQNAGTMSVVSIVGRHTGIAFVGLIHKINHLITNRDHIGHKV